MIAKLIIPHSTQADEGMRIDSLQPNQPESGGKLNAFFTSQLWLEKGLCLVLKHLILCKWKKTINLVAVQLTLLTFKVATVSQDNKNNQPK